MTGYIIALCTAAALGAYIIISKRRQDRRLLALAQMLDGIVAGTETLSPMDDFGSGAFAVLKSEAFKTLAALRSSRDRQEQAKLAMADSLADISHQLRTPLTSMGMIAGFLREENVPDERRREYAAELSSLLARTDRLVSSLLKAARLNAGAVQLRKLYVGAGELVGRATAPLEIQAELKGVALEKNCGAANLCCDPDWTSEAICNIVKNCVEHTPPGGTVSVGAEENPICTEITVADTGSGIAEKDMTHIFERFYKGESSSPESIGIGLYLARVIVLSQKGTLEAENSPSGGARFRIKIYK